MRYLIIIVFLTSCKSQLFVERSKKLEGEWRLEKVMSFEKGLPWYEIDEADNIKIIFNENNEYKLTISKYKETGNWYIKKRGHNLLLKNIKSNKNEAFGLDSATNEELRYFSRLSDKVNFQKMSKEEFVVIFSLPIQKGEDLIGDYYWRKIK